MGKNVTFGVCKGNLACFFGLNKLSEIYPPVQNVCSIS